MSFDPRNQAAYDALQAKLLPLWKSIEQLTNDEQTIVVVPSADVTFELTPDQLQAYEERYLFLLFLLRQPRARMIYITGQPIDPDIVDYYLDVMPGAIASHARRRLVLLSPEEATTRPLAEKLLDRPTCSTRSGTRFQIRIAPTLCPSWPLGRTVSLPCAWASRCMAPIPRTRTSARSRQDGNYSQRPGSRILQEEKTSIPSMT